jgi:NitT/TauT family transport system substrate-binding protein
MMMIHHSCKCVVMIVLALNWFAASCAAPTSEMSRPPVKKVKVVLLSYLAFAPYFIAEEEGYFVEQGLGIEYVRFNRSDQAIPALMQGDIDVLGAATSVGVLNAIARGARIKIVADRGSFAAGGCAYSAIVARRSGLRSENQARPVRLKGRKVVLSSGLYESYAIETFLATDGLTINDLQIIDIPSSVLPEALTKGTIDFAVVAEPWVTRSVQSSHAVIWKPLNEILPGFQSAFIMYGPSFLDRDRETGRRFMTAYLKAVRQYNQGKTERNLDIVAKHTGLDRELLRQACWPVIRDDGRINVQSLLDFQSWAQKKGLVDAPVTPDQLWETSFVEQANAQ